MAKHKPRKRTPAPRTRRVKSLHWKRGSGSENHAYEWEATSPDHRYHYVIVTNDRARFYVVVYDSATPATSYGGWKRSELPGTFPSKYEAEWAAVMHAAGPRANPLSDGHASALVFGVGAILLSAVGYAIYRAVNAPAAASAVPPVIVPPAQGATWKLLGPADLVSQTGLYLFSMTPVPGKTYADFQAEVSDTSVATWDAGAVPPNWPEDDLTPLRWRAEIVKKNAGAGSITMAQLAQDYPGARVYALDIPAVTGGAPHPLLG